MVAAGKRLAHQALAGRSGAHVGRVGRGIGADARNVHEAPHAGGRRGLCDVPGAPAVDRLEAAAAALDVMADRIDYGIGAAAARARPSLRPTRLPGPA